MPGIVDLKRKFDALVRFAGVRTPNQLLNFVGDKSDADIQNNMKNWRTDAAKISTPGPAWTDFFNKILSRVESRLDKDTFFNSSYEVFIESTPPQIRTRLDPNAADDDRVSIFIDPRHHSLDLERTWAETHVVDQRFMYISRFAVNDWNKLVDNGQYETYEFCQEVLEETLKDDCFKNLDNVVILGAGSYSKDREIVRALNGRRSQKTPLRIIIIDASFYMLIDTYSKMKQFVSLQNYKCDIEMHCFDFSDATAWKTNVKIKPSDKTAYFILGGTIGNLREAHFFEVMRTCLDGNDLICIAGEFFESSAEIERSRATILGYYDNDEARDLALGPVNDILNREEHPKSQIERRAFVEVKLENALRLPGNLSSVIPGTQAVTFRTTGNIRTPGSTFPPMALVTSKRYVIDAFVEMLSQLCDLELRANYSHSEARFRHLIFCKSNAVDTANPEEIIDDQ